MNTISRRDAENIFQDAVAGMLSARALSDVQFLERRDELNFAHLQPLIDQRLQEQALEAEWLAASEEIERAAAE